MVKGYRYKPAKFFALTFLITWGAWFASAVLSFREGMESAYVLVMLPGLVAPFLVALAMIVSSGSEELKADFKARLVGLKRLRPSSFPVMLLVMPAAIAPSILVSLLFGQSLDQFSLAQGFSFSAGAVPALLILFLAAGFEELGWRGYALDSLRGRLSLFSATFVFSVLWGLWHLPLFFVKDYYQYNLLHESVWYAANFFVSIIPMAFIITWVCQKNGGSILAAAFFHFLTNLFQEAFALSQVAKCVETVFLAAIAAALVASDRRTFFARPLQPSASGRKEFG